jgi:hypothetical protein
MAKLSQKALSKIVDDGIRREGKYLVLPSDPAPGMTYREGAKALMDKAEQEEMS